MVLLYTANIVGEGEKEKAMNRKNRWGRSTRLSFLFFLIGFCPISSTLLPPPGHYDLVIRNTRIVDGTGRASFISDLAIRNEKIVAVGKVEGRGEAEIDASSLVTCPGFIDTHSHADNSLVQFPLAENFIMQGITTVLGGNCGGSQAPRRDLTFGQWLANVEKCSVSINYVPLVGHNTIRALVLGQDFKREANEKEIGKMVPYVEEAMKSGAFGISSFFDPSPGEYASREEIVELVKVAKRYGGLYSPHTRHHQNQWWSDDPDEYAYGIFHAPKGEIIVGRYHGLLEAIEISKKANNIPLLIAHLTPAYTIPEPHPEFLQEAVARATLIEIIDKAREEGIEVHFNVIPCPFSVGAQELVMNSFFDTRLALPDWLKNMPREKFVGQLSRKEFRERVKSVINSGKFKFGMLHPLTDPYWIDCYRILSCKNKEYQGKTLGEIARNRAPDNILRAVYHESIEALFDIIIEDPQATWALILDKREYPGALPVFLKHPAGMPCLDCGALPAQPLKTPEDLTYGNSPSSFGGFPYYLNYFVKEKGILGLEEAIKKVTYTPAQEVLKLKDRGVIGQGAYADLVIFDLKGIRMSGDYLAPSRPPEGIKYVLVNGSIVYKNKTFTGKRPGKVIRHKS